MLYIRAPPYSDCCCSFKPSNSSKKDTSEY